MSSRSAIVLVIFIVAVVAFCFASVFAAMTGPISILPNESDSGGLLNNFSSPDNTDNNYYPDYSDSSDNSYDSSYDDSKVETTTDDSQDSGSQNSNQQKEPSDSGDNSHSDSGSKQDSDSKSGVETTTG